MLSFLCHRLSAGTSAYWLWLNYSFEPQDCCLATWSMSMTVWGLTGQSAGNAAMMGEWKWSMLSPLTPLHQQKCYTCSLAVRWVLALIQHRLFFFFFFPSPTILHNKISSTCSDVRWWIDLCRRSNTVACHDDACFGGIDHLKLLKLREFMPTAWQ